MVAKKITRREFVEGLTVGGVAGFLAAAGIHTMVFPQTLSPPVLPKEMDIGEIESLEIKCISETSWFDNATLLRDIRAAGGVLVNQYQIGWPCPGNPKYDGDLHPENAGGYAALLDIDGVDGSHYTILLDTGWSKDWMTECFQREGIDKMLEKNEIDFQYISHEHFDHWWGYPATTQYNKDLPLMIPDTWYPESLEIISASGHTGEVKKMPPGIHKLFPGCVSVTFDIPIITRVRGEQVLYFNVRDYGYVTVTGCCHPGLITLCEYAKINFKGGSEMYGVYGGLHISPFEDWDPMNDDLVLGLGKYNTKKLGANHCTGYITVEKMIEAGLPVVRGTARYRTKRDIYLGNSDTIKFP